MFKIAVKPSFKTTVEVHIPGEKAPAEINATFKYLTPEALKSWQQTYGNSSTIDALADLLIDWDVVDENGDAVPCNPANLTALCGQFHTVENNFIQAYFREIYGARRKN